MNASSLQKPFVLAFCAAVVLMPFGPAAAENPDHVARFKQTHECGGCDLRNAQLAGIQAPKAKLVNASLQEANFYGGNLRGADLTGAVLDGANLEMVDLSGAIGAVLGTARTDKRTKCPDGTAGPWQ